MKMHILSGGRLRMRKSTYLPDADRSETIELPVSSVLLRHKQANVLFDTGCHPSVAENAEARWGGMARVVKPIMAPDDNVLTGLAELGLAPEDIDVVINSHFHPDHCGCNGFFKKATIIVHALELETAKAPGSTERGYIAAEWDHPMPIETIGGQRDLLGDGRVVLIPLPGHTPGMIGALAALNRCGTFLLASDAVSLRATLDRDIVPRNTWNAEALLASLAEIRRLEEGGATVLCGHDAQQWVSLRKGAHAYD
ncbi:MAG: N-acyl homoserine lactonase family protein [Hyphomicrobiaceae bacterium]|nr:MAG: N-acyl homoserine lactonase family protein [Hyphomicrobiaceae bacterium]